MLSLLIVYGSKILAPLLRFLAYLWARWHIHRLLKSGWLNPHDLAFRLISLDVFCEVAILDMSSIAPRTSLRDVYEGNSLATWQVVASCGKKGNPFLSTGDPKRQKVLLGPILEIISSCYSGAAMARVAGCAPTKPVELVFGLGFFEGGDNNQYRVLVVSLKHLQMMCSLEADVESGCVQVPDNFRFLVRPLQAMALCHQEEMTTYGCLQTLGQLTVLCIDYYALAQIKGIYNT